jgi:serine-type D-Ala-D-Ala carboxypeptidase/endopeptidase
MLALAGSAALTAFGRPDLDAALKSWAGAPRPGGSVVAYVDADGVAFATTGQFAPADPRPITADTEFEIGSITKVFTSILLADSERAGKVSRDDSAAKFLLPPGDPDAPKLTKITLLALATHSAGLPRMPPNQPEAAGPHPYARYDRARLVEALRLTGPSAPAGAAVAYSNFGGAVLGEALAAAWGRSYGDVLTERILAPLGLRHTSLNMTGSTPPADFAPGFASERSVDHWTFEAMAPAGALISSARDLTLFVQACLGLRETPLQPTLAETFKPQRKMDSVAREIGLAWLIVTDAAGRPVWWHNGGTGGFRSFVGFSAATRTGVVVLTSNSANNPDALGLELLGAKSPQRPPVTMANATDYAGSFTLAPGFSVVILERRGAMYFQATGEPPYAMRRKSGDDFSLEGSVVGVSFERDPAGKVAALILHQNGRSPRAPRTPELTLAPEKLGEYAGEYTLAPQVTLAVMPEGSKLFTQLTGQPKFELFASALDEFFLKIVNAQLLFQRDAIGKVNAVVLRQNGREQLAPKKP